MGYFIAGLPTAGATSSKTNRKRYCVTHRQEFETDLEFHAHEAHAEHDRTCVLADLVDGLHLEVPHPLALTHEAREPEVPHPLAGTPAPVHPAAISFDLSFENPEHAASEDDPGDPEFDVDAFVAEDDPPPEA